MIEPFGMLILHVLSLGAYKLNKSLKLFLTTFFNSSASMLRSFAIISIACGTVAGVLCSPLTGPMYGESTNFRVCQ